MRNSVDQSKNKPNAEQEDKKNECENAQNHNTSFEPFVKCGKVYNPVLPIQLNKTEDPIILTEVTVDIEKNRKLCVLTNFSSFLTSVLKEENFVNLTFRLVKTCGDSTTEILREWPFRRAFVNDTNIKEPVVYDYCECLNGVKHIHCTYTMQLVEVELSANTYYDITQKSITAQVYYGTGQQEISQKGEAVWDHTPPCQC